MILAVVVAAVVKPHWKLVNVSIQAVFLPLSTSVIKIDCWRASFIASLYRRVFDFALVSEKVPGEFRKQSKLKTDTSGWPAFSHQQHPDSQHRGRKQTKKSPRIHSFFEIISMKKLVLPSRVGTSTKNYADFANTSVWWALYILLKTQSNRSGTVPFIIWDMQVILCFVQSTLWIKSSMQTKPKWYHQGWGGGGSGVCLFLKRNKVIITFQARGMANIKNTSFFKIPKAPKHTHRNTCTVRQNYLTDIG